MGRSLSQSSGAYVPNYLENATESNSSRFSCRCIYTTPGSYTFTVPSGVCSITAVAVGPGGCANCVVKLKEKYIYKLTECVSTYRRQVTCEAAVSPLSPGYGNDPSGIICSGTNVSASFNLYGYSCCTVSPSTLDGRGYFRDNINSVYTQLDYALIDSAPGGGYSEKQISTTPGSTFSIVVGQNSGNNFSCVNGQICATGACIVNGSGISTDTQYTSFCGSESFVCCVADCYRCESYSRSGPVCYIKEKVVDSTLIPGCGYGGTVNRTGGFGCKVRSFCFPMGFDSFNCDQCFCCVCYCNCCCAVTPTFFISRNISISTCISGNPSLDSISQCPSDLVTNHDCYFPNRIWYCCCLCNCCFFSRNGCGRRNRFTYFDTICKDFAACCNCCWDPECNFLLPSCYCGISFSQSRNFIGLVTNITNDTNCIITICNIGGGSSGGSPCFNGVYHSSSTVCDFSKSSTDKPTITSCFCGRPVFTDGVCMAACPLETRVYGTYDPSSLDLGYSRGAIVANTGCNPCNCKDIGCFFCTCRFDIAKNMWGIVSGPECFAYGSIGIGNSLTICDPLRFVRSLGSRGPNCCCHFYCNECACPCQLCYGQCVGTISYFGSSTDMPQIYLNFYPCCRCEYAVTLHKNCCEATYYRMCYINCFNNLVQCNYCCCWPQTSYWPTCKGYSSTAGSCCTAIPTFNLHDILCDGTGKCVRFCCTCTDAGKQFQTSLGEYGIDAIRAHFSPCACSAKCFGSYCDWPCYFASVGIGTTIPCGGNSPLVPREDLDVCDPRYIPNNYHDMSIIHNYNLGSQSSRIWGKSSNCIYCNVFAAASSNLFRNYKVGTTVDTGAGIGYDGTASESGYTCCFCYFVGSNTCGCTTGYMCGTITGNTSAYSGSNCGCTCGCIVPLCYTEVLAIKDHGGGGGTYSNSVSTKIYRIGRCSSVIMTPSGGKGWGDYDMPLVEIDGSTSKLNAPSSNPRIPDWFDVRQAKGSGARGPICIDGIVYSPVKAGPGGGGISGFGNEYASTCLFGGAVCSGTAGPGGGAGGQGTPGTGMVVIYWNP